MRVLSLFSGIGGFDLGFQRAGMQIVGMCEYDKHAQQVLRTHFPEATLHNDVREVEYAPGTIDIICGGFPCQDLSVAGKRKGLAGERSSLWFEFARIIKTAQPAWVVIENVPGLLSSNGGRDFATIIYTLGEYGYGVGWRVLNSQFFGVAQRRRRVFIVASFRNKRACTVLLERESMQRDNTQSRKAKQNHTTTTDAGTTAHTRAYVMREDAKAGNMHINPAEVSLTLQAMQASPTAHHAQLLLATSAESVNEIYAIDSASSNSWKSDNPNSGIHKTQLARTIDTTGTNPGSNQGGNLIVPIMTAVHTIPGDIIGRNNSRGNHDGWSDKNISYTLTAQDVHAVTDIPILWECTHTDDPTRVCTGGNNVPMVGVRRLTPTECERLQGFPDGWTTNQSDAQRYKQLGNAVTVPVAEWIAKRILQSDKGELR